MVKIVVGLLFFRRAHLIFCYSAVETQACDRITYVLHDFLFLLFVSLLFDRAAQCGGRRSIMLPAPHIREDR